MLQPGFDESSFFRTIASKSSIIRFFLSRALFKVQPYQHTNKNKNNHIQCGVNDIFHSLPPFFFQCF